MRSSVALLGTCAAALVMATAVAGERDAQACGGCFHPPEPPGEHTSVVTDHRMILSVSPQQTTLYDQIRYAGNPSSFAWVLPIAGEATIGLSSDTLFTAIDQITGTTVVAPPMNCPAPPSFCNSSFGAGGAEDTTGAAPGVASDGGTVSVTKHEVVGPYETVQLHSTDPNALNDWLTSHGYVVPDDVKPIIAAYVNEHFDFLALKLVPGAGVSAMRPVRVSTAGAAPILPLRMVAAGTGAKVGITLWVLADGRYEPQNFSFFQVKDADLVWDWNTSQSNFTTLRADEESRSGFHAWELESSTTQSQANVRTYVTQQGQFGNGGPDAGQDYLPIQAPDGGGIIETSDAVRQDDFKALFAGIGTSDGQVRITRVRTDLAHDALGTDLALQASADQSVITNLRKVTKEANEPQCPLYDGQCRQVGTAPRSQAAQASKESFSCSTSPAASETGPLPGPLFFASMGGLLGITLLGIRRRRAS
jgi:hypothetical protein